MIRVHSIPSSVKFLLLRAIQLASTQASAEFAAAVLINSELKARCSWAPPLYGPNDVQIATKLPRNHTKPAWFLGKDGCFHSASVQSSPNDSIYQIHLDASSTCLCDKHWVFSFAFQFLLLGLGPRGHPVVKSSCGLSCYISYIVSFVLADVFLLFLSVGPKDKEPLCFRRRAFTVNYRKIFPRHPKWYSTICCFGYILYRSWS